MARPPRDAAEPRESRAYSRFVGTMKIVLPVLAALMVILVVAWPQLDGSGERFRIGEARIDLDDTGRQRLVNARYSGIDAADRPYSLSADSVMGLGAGNPDAVALERPKADITLADGSWVALTAEAGVYRRPDKLLVLDGTVGLFHDAGYEFHTASATVDFGRGVAYGFDPVTGQGPFGVITAAGFHVLDKGERIIFTGKARLELEPSAVRTGR